jgi:hypothetical protein
MQFSGFSSIYFSGLPALDTQAAPAGEQDHPRRVVITEVQEDDHLTDAIDLMHCKFVLLTVQVCVEYSVSVVCLQCTYRVCIPKAQWKCQCEC